VTPSNTTASARHMLRRKSSYTSLTPTGTSSGSAHGRALPPQPAFEVLIQSSSSYELHNVQTISEASDVHSHGFMLLVAHLSLYLDTASMQVGESGGERVRYSAVRVPPMKESHSPSPTHSDGSVRVERGCAMVLSECLSHTNALRADAPLPAHRVPGPGSAGRVPGSLCLRPRRRRRGAAAQRRRPPPLLALRHCRLPAGGGAPPARAWPRVWPRVCERRRRRRRRRR
jgi:hypothetical protein